MQRSEYKETFAISQSSIKAFRTKPLQKFKQIYIDKEEQDEDESKFAFGSLVDTLAFEPTLLDERFFICDEDVNIPGEKVKIIVDKVYKEAVVIVENKTKLNEQGNLPEPVYIPHINELDNFNDLIVKYAKEIGYGGSTWTSNRIIDTVQDAAYGYFRMLGNCNGRSIITPMDNADAIGTVANLRKDKNTNKYFEDQKDETLLFQQEIFIEYKDDNGNIIPLKGALDIIRLNHKDKTCEVVDLKTTHNSLGFKHVARTFDYITQVSFYSFLLKEFLKDYQGGKYQKYEMLPSLNIVIDKEYKIPYIYEYSFEDLEIAKNGKKDDDFRGWKEILNLIGWHINTNVWDVPKELYENGKIKLKIF